jgi:Family of unknown function (DUF6523)
MAVPRTEKVANAVFEQEEALMKGVLRLFPKLKDAELEYGHNLKVCVRHSGSRTANAVYIDPIFRRTC